MKRIDVSKIITELRIESHWQLPPADEIVCVQASVSEMRGIGASVKLRRVGYATCKACRGWHEDVQLAGMRPGENWLVVLDSDFVSRVMALGDPQAIRYILRSVIKHELAHISQFWVDNRSSRTRYYGGGHDSYFHSLMISVGLPPSRYCGGKWDEPISDTIPLTWGEFWDGYMTRD